MILGYGDKFEQGLFFISEIMMFAAPGDKCRDCGSDM